MIPAICTDITLNAPAIVAVNPPRNHQKRRIQAALEVDGNHLPLVDEETLYRYFEYLSENLLLPFTAHYPEPTTPLEEAQYECTVLELLSPSNHACDEFDGIFCKTRKAGFEVNLPLIELEVPKNSPNFQMIEDYWYWLWNWRCGWYAGNI